MKWNWQQPDWPRFSWSRDRMTRAEEQFLVGGGVILGAVSHLDGESRDRLTVESMSEEAVTSSAIEGEVLDRDSVQSSIRRHLGLAPDARRASPAEQGIAEMMVALYRDSAKPLDEATLCSWHHMLMQGRRDVHDIGRYVDARDRPRLARRADWRRPATEEKRIRRLRQAPGLISTKPLG